LTTWAQLRLLARLRELLGGVDDVVRDSFDLGEQRRDRRGVEFLPVRGERLLDDVLPAFEFGIIPPPLDGLGETRMIIPGVVVPQREVSRPPVTVAEEVRDGDYQRLGHRGGDPEIRLGERLEDALPVVLGELGEHSY
jgi:hypothetical protein